jgi:hypothetical protein
MNDLTTAADAPTPFIVAKTLAAQGLAVFPVRRMASTPQPPISPLSSGWIGATQMAAASQPER